MMKPTKKFILGVRAFLPLPARNSNSETLPGKGLKTNCNYRNLSTFGNLRLVLKRGYLLGRNLDHSNPDVSKLEF